MRKLKFKSEIVGVPFNTNNAWGFGGGIGTEWTFPNGISYRAGTAYFRHMPQQSFARFLDADCREMSYADGRAAVAEWLA